MLQIGNVITAEKHQQCNYVETVMVYKTEMHVAVEMWFCRDWYKQDKKTQRWKLL